MFTLEKNVDAENLKDTRWSAYLNYSLAAFAFFLPLSRSGISVLVVVIPLLWIVEGQMKYKWNLLKQNKLFISLFAYLGFILLSFLWTENYLRAINSIRNYGHLLLIPVMMTSLRRQYLIWILRAFAAGMLTLLLLSLLNYSGIITIYSKVHSATPFMHHLDYSMMLSWSIILAAYQFPVNFRKKQRFELYALWGTLGIFGLIWLFVQNGRSGQFAIVVSFVFFFYTLFKENQKKYFYIWIGFIILALVAIYKFTPLLERSVDQTRDHVERAMRGDYNTSTGIRILTTRLVLDMIVHNPVIGYGAGDAMVVFSDWIYYEHTPDPSLSRAMRDVIFQIIGENHFHNQYFQILAELGIIGLFLFFSMFWYWYRGARDKTLAILFILIFFTGFLVEPFMRNQITSALISFFLGLIYKYDKNTFQD